MAKAKTECRRRTGGSGTGERDGGAAIGDSGVQYAHVNLGAGKVTVK